MQWREVNGFPGYKVSDEGQVYSLKSNRLLTLQEDMRGYITVGLCNAGKVRTLLVHRLVYEAFIGTIPDKLQVNHKDENKNNNRIDNLELLTPKENSNYGTRNQRIRQSNMRWSKFRRMIKRRAVLQYTLDGVLVRRWDSMAEANDYGFRDYCISKCCKGHMKTHKGYRWEYADNVC